MPENMLSIGDKKSIKILYLFLMNLELLERYMWIQLRCSISVILNVKIAIGAKKYD